MPDTKLIIKVLWCNYNLTPFKSDHFETNCAQLNTLKNQFSISQKVVSVKLIVSNDVINLNSIVTSSFTINFTLTIFVKPMPV